MDNKDYHSDFFINALTALHAALARMDPDRLKVAAEQMTAKSERLHRSFWHLVKQYRSGEIPFTQLSESCADVILNHRTAHYLLTDDTTKALIEEIGDIGLLIRGIDEQLAKVQTTQKKLNTLIEPKSKTT